MLFNFIFVKLQKILLVSVSIVLFFPQFSSAEVLRVWTIERPPFVMQDEEENLTGFSIELWDAVAEKTNLDYQFEKYKIFSDMIDDTKKAKNDLSISNISITSEREMEMDFSNPIFDSWLAMMVKSSSLERDPYFKEFFKKSSFLIVFFVLVLLPFILKGGSILKKSLKKEHKKYAYRNVFIYVLICSSVFSVLYTHMAIKDRQYWTYNIVTLPDKKIGVIIGSTAERFVENFKLDGIGYSTINELYTGLESGEIEVIVHDFPVLSYKSEENPDFSVVGETFKKEKYGIAFPNNSDLKESINIAILELRSEWLYDELYVKYFWNN